MSHDVSKVLVITHAFPPANGSAVQRPLKFVKFLPSFNWQPFVVTPEKNFGPIDNALSIDIPQSASVHEVFSISPTNLNAIVAKKKAAKGSNSLALNFLKILIKIYSIFYYRLYIVDWYDGWVPFGLWRALRIIRREDIKLLFVDLEPPSSSLIALALKKLTNKPLVVDYHDPWTTSVDFKQSNGLRKRLSEYLEQKVLSCAEKATVGKDVISTELIHKFPYLNRDKFKTITSGYDPDDFQYWVKKDNSKFTITYTGRISEKFYYSPESFLAALGELIKEGMIPRNDIAVHFIGPISPQYHERFENIVKKHQIEDIVETTGSIDHRSCVDCQMNANVLLYIIESLEGKKSSYRFSGALPSKLYEYIYTGNPILAIVPPGIEAEIINKTGTGYVAEPNNVTAIKSVIQMLYKQYTSNNLSIEPVKHQIAKFHRKSLTAKLSSIFNELVEKRTNFK